MGLLSGAYTRELTSHHRQPASEATCTAPHTNFVHASTCEERVFFADKTPTNSLLVGTRANTPLSLAKPFGGQTGLGEGVNLIFLRGLGLGFGLGFGFADEEVLGFAEACEVALVVALAVALVVAFTVALVVAFAVALLVAFGDGCADLEAATAPEDEKRNISDANCSKN